jgi:signal transduction histidine kinase
MMTSLRARLTLLVTLLVAAAVLALSLMQIDRLVETWVRHTTEQTFTTAQMVKRHVLQRASERLQNTPNPPHSIDESIEIWEQAVEEDMELTPLLLDTLAQTSSIIEISVAGRKGRILAGSEPSRVGRLMVPRLNIQNLAEMGAVSRFLAILGGNIDYESRAALGVMQGRRETVFTIQVLTTSALLRKSILPDIIRTASVSLAVLVLSMLISYVTARLALRPLDRLGQVMDDIARGHVHSGERPISSAREFAVVQEKLRLLGEQFRGAQQGATQLRGSFQQMLDRLETTTLLFDAEGALMMTGPRAEQLLGASREELSGRTILSLFPALDPTDLDRPLGNQRTGNLLADIEPVPGGGWLVRLRDPAGRRLLESQLNVSSRLAAISRLTGGVAHEIKNPLNSIALHLELLREMVLPQVPEARPQVDVIAEEIARLDRVVRTFLDFTRPVELETNTIDLRDTLESLSALIRPEAEAGKVEISTELPSNPVPVRVDEGLLKQALMNVVRNALDAMPDGGKLTLNLRAGDDAVISIADTGCGIPPENRERIFQLYFSTKEKGTGIGLAMTFRAVQMHGGSVDFDSSAGNGTRFQIRLPRLVQEEA